MRTLHQGHHGLSEKPFGYALYGITAFGLGVLVVFQFFVLLLYELPVVQAAAAFLEISQVLHGVVIEFVVLRVKKVRGKNLIKS